jgi:two-component system, LytTR family, response regulator LytT
MINILILEDETNAAIRLQQLLKDVEPSANVLAVLETVKETAQWMGANSGKQIDLILSDIQLADGLSLDAFKQVNSKTPVIFTTAYDAYTLRAFKLNSIDYLLKPVDKDELQAAIAKYRSLHGQQNDISQMLGIFQNMAAGKSSYKSRFLVRQGDRLITIPCDDVAYVRADDKVVFLHTAKGQKHIIDDSLDDLEKALDPARFFRINRTYIAPLTSIEKINNHFNGRLKISLLQSQDNEIFISRARAAAFKEWLNK